jgi:hypothetical protein
MKGEIGCVGASQFARERRIITGDKGLIEWRGGLYSVGGGEGGRRRKNVDFARLMTDLDWPLASSGAASRRSGVD